MTHSPKSAAGNSAIRARLPLDRLTCCIALTSVLHLAACGARDPTAALVADVVNPATQGNYSASLAHVAPDRRRDYDGVPKGVWPTEMDMTGCRSVPYQITTRDSPLGLRIVVVTFQAPCVTISGYRTNKIGLFLDRANNTYYLGSITN